MGSKVDLGKSVRPYLKNKLKQKDRSMVSVAETLSSITSMGGGSP
jgi:hypothetical protein